MSRNWLDIGVFHISCKTFYISHERFYLPEFAVWVMRYNTSNISHCCWVTLLLFAYFQLFCQVLFSLILTVSFIVYLGYTCHYVSVSRLVEIIACLLNSKVTNNSLLFRTNFHGIFDTTITIFNHFWL